MSDIPAVVDEPLAFAVDDLSGIGAQIAGELPDCAVLRAPAVAVKLVRRIRRDGNGSRFRGRGGGRRRDRASRGQLTDHCETQHRQQEQPSSPPARW